MLKDQTLSYYKSPKDTTPVGIIPMDDIIKKKFIEQKDLTSILLDNALLSHSLGQL